MAAITRTLRPFSCGIHSDESERDLGNPSTNSPGFSAADTCFYVPAVLIPTVP